MAEDRPIVSTEPPLQTPPPLLPPPFIRLPFAQMPPPSFWPIQDYHTQFVGIRSPQMSDHPNLHHPHSTFFSAAPDFPPPHPSIRPPAAMFSLLASLTSHTPPAGLQLFTESPESSLLDPHTSPPPPRPCEQQQQPTMQVTSHSHHQNSAAAPMAEQLGEYPPPLASHKEVLAKKHIFYDTLSKLLAYLEIKARVPKVGGKELDLHTFYHEVTKCGGFKEATKLNRWRDIIAALKLPVRVSSPSFFVRKHYANLLYHYEQVYFFRIQGKMVPLPENLEPAKKRRRRKSNTIETPGVDPGKSVGRNVTGAIEGKFEHGYLVTVVVGTEKMRGVLYHVQSENDTPQFASALPELVNKLSSTPNALGTRRKSRNENNKKKDPNAPRSSRSGYNYFFAEQRLKLKEYGPATRTEITKVIGELWHRLTPEERTPYLERGKTDKDRYKKEKKEYQETLKMQAETKHETGSNQAHLESLDDSGQGFEQLEQDNDVDDDADHEIDSDHDYHVSLDADLDTSAFNLPQEQGLQTQMFGDFVPDGHIQYGQDEGFKASEARDVDQPGVYVAPTEGYEEEEDDDEDGVYEDDHNDDDGDDNDDDEDENEVGEDDG